MDLWFGDSWTIGSELGLINDPLDNESLKQRLLNKQNSNIFPNAIFGLDNPLKAFPAVVSAHRNQQYVNFAMNGASVQFALHQLVSFCSSNINLLSKNTKHCTAFLCLTVLVRSFGINSITNKQHHSSNIELENNTIIYDSLMAINSFYAICKMYNIECVIIPIFCDLTIPNSTAFNELILFNDSVLSYTSLVELTFGDKLFNLDSSTNIEVAAKNFSVDIKSKDWIKPNNSHPNEFGHKKLAYKLIKLLEDR